MKKPKIKTISLGEDSRCGIRELHDGHREIIETALYGMFMNVLASENIEKCKQIKDTAHRLHFGELAFEMGQEIKKYKLLK